MKGVAVGPKHKEDSVSNGENDEDKVDSVSNGEDSVSDGGTV